MRDSFVFYKSWKDAMGELPNDIRLEVYESIIRYACGETVEGLKSLAQVAFAFIKQDIDRMREKEIEFIENQRSNGSKGGAKKGNQNARKHKKEDEENNPKQPKTTLNDNVDVDVNVNDNDLRKEKGKKKSSPNGDPPSNYFKLLFEKRKKEFYDECAKLVKTYDPEMIRAFFDYWTEPNKSKTKMRYELENTWDLPRRLKTWENRDFKFNNKNKNETKSKEYPKFKDAGDD